ncbi:hypothetical protein WMY93_015372 [Mugilogobius chulae]|uniref:Uncharacterized protein n=1 Tax=Mugilogobius chulae TaxID=88201 RepID=A0AAW0NX07_9GOBI
MAMLLNSVRSSPVSPARALQYAARSLSTTTQLHAQEHRIKNTRNGCPRSGQNGLEVRIRTGVRTLSNPAVRASRALHQTHTGEKNDPSRVQLLKSPAPQESSSSRVQLLKSPAPQESSSSRVQLLKSPAPQESSSSRVQLLKSPAPQESSSSGAVSVHGN